MNDIFKKSYLSLILIGILISFILAYSSYQNQIDKEQIQFNFHSKNIIKQIENRMDTYREILYSTQGFFEASRNVTRKEWHIFSKKLQVQKYFPGIQGFGYSILLKKEDAEKHTENIRNEGFPEYEIKPKGQRELYSSIIYIEPFDSRNKRAFGYDMYSEEQRRKAMNRAIETGLPSLSTKVNLVQENGKDIQSGFLLYTPHYKNIELKTKEKRYEAIRGFIYAVFRTKDFITAALGNSLEIMNIKMYDGVIKNKDTLLYDSSTASNIDNIFVKTITIKLDGHSWTFEISAKKDFFDSQKYINAFIFIFLGFLVTFLVASLVKKESEVEVENKTKDLLHEQNTLLSLFDKGDIVLFKWERVEIFDNKINWNITHASNSVNKLFGFKPSSFTSNEVKYNSFVFNEDLDNFKKEIFEAIKENKKFFIHKPYRIISKDKKIKWVSHYTIIKKDTKKDTIYFIGYIINITEQKNLEENLIKAKEQAESSSKAKTEFLSNMSHEIRTPLNGIIGLTNLLLDTSLNDIQKKYLEQSKSSSHALLHVINDVLDYSKIEVNKIELESIPFQLDKLLHEVSNLFIFEAQNKNIHLDSSIASSIHNNLIGDPFRINQILINLVGNAIKFTEKGVINIDVQLEGATKDTLMLKFNITDTGIGISKDKQKKLFKDFSQVDTSNTREYGGSGLGLIISQKLARLMKGDITVKSIENKGSTFSFTSIVSYIKEDYEFLSQGLKDKRILVITNNQQLKATLVESLTMLTLKTTTSKDEKEAVELFNKKSFSYIILDWNLANENKTDFIKTIDFFNNKKNTKIVLVSSFFKKEELINLTKDIGIKLNQLLIKPFSSSTLLDTLVNNSEIELKEDKSNKRLLAKGKVLLVEDNKINQTVAKQNLENFGLEVITVENGKLAVEKAKKEKFDIIFMDLQMPVMDGIEASKKIREFSSNIPIIALSAAVMEDDIKMTKKAGMNEHLSKPIDIQKLEEVLITYLEASFIQKEVKRKLNNYKYIKGVDIKELITRLNNNEELSYKMLANFATEKKDIIKELDDLNIDSKEFSSLIHKIKGLSGNLSLSDVFKYSKQIYSSNDLENKALLLTKLKDSLSLVINEINNKISHLDIKNEIVNISSKQDILKNIEAFNQDLSKGIFISQEKRHQIINQINQISNNDISDEIDKYLSTFDYKNVQLLLKKVIGELS